MEELWDSLEQEENEIEGTEWHKDILESRRKKIKKTIFIKKKRVLKQRRRERKVRKRLLPFNLFFVFS